MEDLVGGGWRSLRLCLASCQTGPNTALPTAEAAASARGGHDNDISTLALDRKIYTTSCTECHVARPIAQRSVEQWRQIIRVMAPRAGLKPEDRVALEAYLIAARRSQPSS